MKFVLLGAAIINRVFLSPGEDPDQEKTLYITNLNHLSPSSSTLFAISSVERELLNLKCR